MRSRAIGWAACLAISACGPAGGEAAWPEVSAAAYCPTFEGARQELMDRIEGAVRLPEGASPLTHYARYYSCGERGGRTGDPGPTVLAVYLRPWWGEPRPANWTCSRYPSMKTVPCAPELDMSSEPRAGERRWVERHDDIPSVFDGGCSVVAFRYHVRTTELEAPFCNGRA